MGEFGDKIVKAVNDIMMGELLMEKETICGGYSNICAVEFAGHARFYV